MARFYAIENIALRVVTELRGLGHDVHLARGRKGERGRPGLRGDGFRSRRKPYFAIAQSSPLPSTPSTQTGRHAEIVLCTFDLDFAGQAQRIQAAVAALPDMVDQLIRVNRPG